MLQLEGCPVILWSSVCTRIRKPFPEDLASGSHLESPPYKNGAMTPLCWVMPPILKGHGDSSVTSKQLLKARFTAASVGITRKKSAVCWRVTWEFRCAKWTHLGCHDPSAKVNDFWWVQYGKKTTVPQKLKSNIQAIVRGLDL